MEISAFVSDILKLVELAGVDGSVLAKLTKLIVAENVVDGTLAEEIVIDRPIVKVI